MLQRSVASLATPILLAVLVDQRNLNREASTL